ncbi:MAG: AIR synthase related protein, partial [Candidatus Margulisiibacteriota bacterium]
MINRIETCFKIQDARAEIRKKRLWMLGYRQIKKVFLNDVYTINKNLTFIQLKKIAQSLCNPLTQTFSINQPLCPPQFTWAVEIGFLPGVTDNVATTTKEIIEDLLKLKFNHNEGVYSSFLIFIDGLVNHKEIVLIAKDLTNPLIQRVHIKDEKTFKKEGGMNKIIPKITLGKKIKASKINLNVSDEELVKIGKEGIKNPDGTRRGPLALDLFYLKAIQKYFKNLGRDPTDIELESIAQTWSEHCKHTIFADPIDEVKKGLFKTYIKKATEIICQKKRKDNFCVSVFKDNSGAIEFEKNYLITHKIETHNSPSALDPFGGSITGILGVNRDAIGFGLGAKPIANCFGFCFAPPNTRRILYRDKNLTQKMLPSKKIIEGVVQGVNVGANCSGIPTPQG